VVTKSSPRPKVSPEKALIPTRAGCNRCSQPILAQIEPKTVLATAHDPRAETPCSSEKLKNKTPKTSQGNPSPRRLMKQATVITHLMCRAFTGNLGGETQGLWAKPFAATAAHRAKDGAL
jgi:hypothetical protein